jgi:hypothetical protein
VTVAATCAHWIAPGLGGVILGIVLWELARNLMGGGE